MSVILEFFLLKRNPVDYWYIGIAVFGFAQMLRYWAIITLGERWNTRIIILKGDMLIQGGPYKYLRHPNYAAVAIEMAVLPLVFSCYLTSITFTVLNFIVLRRRIKIENHALGYTNK
jgi:methyltransferase